MGDDTSYPVVEQQSDGQWKAWYPEEGVYYFGDTEEDAKAQLPVRKVSPRPQLRKIAEGWEASDPDLGISVVEPTDEAAVRGLNQLRLRLVATDPEFAARFEHFREHPPRECVEFISKKAFRSLLDTELGARGMVRREHGVVSPEGWVATSSESWRAEADWVKDFDEDLSQRDR